MSVAISATMSVLTGTITALASVGAKEEIGRVKQNDAVIDFSISLTTILNDLDDYLDNAKKKERAQIG